MYGTYGTYSNPAAILPTGEKMNPVAPESATYYDKGQTAFVLTKVGDTKPSRVVTTFGWTYADPKAEAVGDTYYYSHDQTGRRMGQYAITGITDFSSGLTFGDVPNRNLNHAVYK